MAIKSGSRKQVVFLGMLIVLAVLVLAGYLLMANRPVMKKIITDGDLAPEFRLQAQDGTYVSLADFRGKVVMVHFWATWCPSCVEEIPTLDTLYRAFAGNDFEMLAVSVDEDGAQAVAPFIYRNRLTVPVLFDPRRSIAGLYGTYKFPETYIVDRQGMVRYKAIGPRNWADSVNMKILQDIIHAR